MSSGEHAFDSREFRDALGRFATGVTIITTTGPDGERLGVTANSFNSVSLDPPLILWSLSRASRSCAAFERATHFAVHILGHDQEMVATRFAGRGEDKFAGLDVHAGLGGVPLLSGCAAHLECATEQRFEGGDHFILLGRVLRFETCDSDPLLFHLGRFRRVEAAL